MESFIEFIFSNLFLVIVILSGIFSMFNKNKEEKKRNSNRPKPAQTPSRKMKEKQPPIRTQERRTRSYETKPEPVQMKSVEDQQQEQMERLRERFTTSVNETVENMNSSDIAKSKARLNSLAKKETSFQKNPQVELNLNQKSVLQGIMMSEVIGTPRARKPYRSIIQERQIK